VVGPKFGRKGSFKLRGKIVYCKKSENPEIVNNKWEWLSTWSNQAYGNFSMG